MIEKLILSFDHQVTLEAAGGKGLNLIRLVQAGFPVPSGFIINATAYISFVNSCGLMALIHKVLNDTQLHDPEVLQIASQAIRSEFDEHNIPSDLAEALRKAYEDLGHPPVAVRSSATSEDLPGLVFCRSA